MQVYKGTLVPYVKMEDMQERAGPSVLSADVASRHRGSSVLLKFVPLNQ